MKHVIVIETVDDDRGIVSDRLQKVLMRAVELGVEDAIGTCYVHGKFNARSAIAATHEMYNAPKWNGGL
jgi:hypothetical protein